MGWTVDLQSVKWGWGLWSGELGSVRWSRVEPREFRAWPQGAELDYGQQSWTTGCIAGTGSAKQGHRMQIRCVKSRTNLQNQDRQSINSEGH